MRAREPQTLRTKVKTLKLVVGKGGLPPLALNGIRRQRGQATLPNPEILFLESLLLGNQGSTPISGRF